MGYPISDNCGDKAEAYNPPILNETDDDKIFEDLKVLH